MMKLARDTLIIACTWALPCAAARAGQGNEAADFVRLGKPGPMDWRTVYPEPIQTRAEYARFAGHAPAFKERQILLVPLGTMREGADKTLAELAEFLGAYFMTRVEVEPRREVPDGIPRRSSHGFGRQLLADDVLRHVALEVPRHVVARVAITSDDLYASTRSGGSMNWVFGMGDARMRAAVCSYARFEWNYPGQPPGATPRRRLHKLVAHEIGHVFGLAHCQTYACGMNGCNSIKESDAAPIHLCPECLDKLSGHLGFDRVQRYAALGRVYRKRGWRKDAAFVARRARAEAGNALLTRGASSGTETRNHVVLETPSDKSRPVDIPLCVSESGMDSGPSREVALSPETRRLCQGFREKEGSLRLDEARKLGRQLGSLSLPVSLVVELLGPPRSRSESSMTYALGYDGQCAHAMHLRIVDGQATVFGFGGGG